MKTLLLSIITTAVFAQFNFKQIDLNGNGCQRGTYDLVITEDQETLSILFNEFIAEVPTMSNSFQERKICNISFTANIPKGMRVGSLAVKTDIRGSLFLDPGVKASFKTAFLEFLASGAKVKKHDIFYEKYWSAQNESLYEDLFISYDKFLRVNSACAGNGGKDITFKLANTVGMNIPHSKAGLGSIGQIAVDSADFQGKMSMKVIMVPCGWQGPKEPSSEEKPLPAICKFAVYKNHFLCQH